MKEFQPELKNFDEILDDNNEKIFDANKSKHFFEDYFGKTVSRSYPNIDNYVGGRWLKHFFLCKSDSIKEVFDEVANPENCYQTCYNELIKKEYKQGGEFPISYVSVLLKQVNSFDNFYMEEFCSKLSNLFGIKTAFYKNYIKDEKQYSLSVDFIGYNQDFKTFEDLEITGETCEMINKALGFIKSQKFTFNKKLFTKNLVEQLIFRLFIICDDDYCKYNCGLLINKEKNFVDLAPNFDMENAFRHRMQYSEQIRIITFLFENFKFETENFVKKSKILVKNNLINKNLFSNINMDQYQRKDSYQEWLLKSVKTNLNRLLSLYKEIEMKNEKNF